MNNKCKAGEITYRDLDKYSDEELMTIFLQSPFYDDESARALLVIAREYYNELKEKNNDEKSRLENFTVNEITDFNLVDLYRWILDYCKDNNLICPIIGLDKKSKHPHIINEILYVPTNYKPAEIQTLIKECQGNERVQKFNEYCNKTCDESVIDIYETILDICRELSISPPYIKFGVIQYNKWITVRGRYTAGMDLLEISLRSDRTHIFLAAHELRHKWQGINNPSILDNYFRLNLLDCYIGTSVISTQRCLDYQVQPAELDANAFAAHYIQTKGANVDSILKREFSNIFNVDSDRYNYLAEKIKQQSQTI